MPWRRSLALLLTVPLSLGSSFAQTKGITALAHVRVIDGTGHAPLEDATILLEGKNILAIQASGATLPAGAQVLDLHGDTVMPGLINAHGHLALIADGHRYIFNCLCE